jgi:hypothetical protein
MTMEINLECKNCSNVLGTASFEDDAEVEQPLKSPNLCPTCFDAIVPAHLPLPEGVMTPTPPPEGAPVLPADWIPPYNRTE